MLQKGHWKSSKNVAQDKDQDRFFMLNNAPWTLYLCSDLINFQQLFPSGCQHITKVSIHSR